MLTAHQISIKLIHLASTRLGRYVLPPQDVGVDVDVDMDVDVLATRE
jgi:hypothetical protein